MLIMSTHNDIKYGLIKPAIDAHTLGINTAAELLRDCNYEVIIADASIAEAMNDYKHEIRRKIVVDWIKASKINRLGLSYRLDQEDAVNMVGYLVGELKKTRLLKFQGGHIEYIFFAGLPSACEAIEREFEGLVKTFIGGESASDTLLKLGVPEYRIPMDITEGSRHDEFLLDFGKQIIDSQDYLKYKPQDRSNYKEYGTDKDTVVKRIEANLKSNFEPLMRGHVDSCYCLAV